MQPGKTTVMTILQGVTITALLALAIFFQAHYDTLTPPFTLKVNAVTRDLLSEKILPYITFGFKNSITDMYWLRAVQDFTVWDGKDTYYLNYFKNISALDPTFEYPYLFSILIVPQKKDVAMLNNVAALAERGITEIPTSWKIPFYLGTQYYIFTKKYEPAEKYLGIAASRKGAPDGVYLNYATFVAKAVPSPIKSAEDHATALSLVKVIYNNTDNETIKKIAGRGLQENLITQMLEKGIAAYHTRYKHYPVSIDEMTKVHLISLPQELVDNFTIIINKKNGSFTIEEKKES